MMRLAHRTLLLAGLIAVPVPALLAQNVPIVIAHPVTVGAITRDAGVYSLYSGSSDAATMRKVNGYLINLESDLAAKVSAMKGISYQDRTATAELLNEVHMSSGRDFDAYTGALRGLMGRLDFLIVIDAVNGSTARMRLIDVQTGSVKGVESCASGSGNARCVDGMADKIRLAGQEQAGVTGALLAQRQEVMAIKHQWDDQVARYEAAKGFWDNIQKTISSGGHALRPEIRTLLNGAAKDVSTGALAVRTLDVEALKTATSTLSDKLDKLDTYR
jgi:hypothetical protein